MTIVRTQGLLKGIPLILMLVGLGACGPQGAQDAISLDHKGDWTFVNYWAKWCKPCIQEVPELNLLHAREGIRVLGVNYDGAVGEELQAQLENLNVQFPTLPEDPAARYQIERPQVLPTTLVINPQGELSAVLIGPQTEASLLNAAGLTESHGVTGGHSLGPS
ncbi:TlpA disulfide reductase family protein [Congregibacter brevis]|uniref:TlpA disulfide reductase family protein n=1 Tax=Congregibacter brevis TaxID=3081201 RepID=A0ABZ0IA43_9GAMM|nr:TlpA disulfide reductase family protein [Congregibacter sp. IMCC45268]